MRPKPSPRPNVYDWLPGTKPSASVTTHDLHTWLREARPDVADCLVALVGGPRRIDELVFVDLDDHARGWCGDALTPESIAFLRAEVGNTFALRVWW